MGTSADDSLRRKASGKPNFFQHVQTTRLKDVPLEEGEDRERSRRPAGSENGAVPGTLRPPPILRREAAAAQAPQTERAAGLSGLAVLVLILSGAALGAIIGTMVATSVFP